MLHRDSPHLFKIGPRSSEQRYWNGNSFAVRFGGSVYHFGSIETAESVAALITTRYQDLKTTAIETDAGVGKEIKDGNWGEPQSVKVLLRALYHFHHPLRCECDFYTCASVTDLSNPVGQFHNHFARGVGMNEPAAVDYRLPPGQLPRMEQDLLPSIQEPLGRHDRRRSRPL